MNTDNMHEAAERARAMADDLVDFAERLEALIDDYTGPAPSPISWDTQTVALLPEPCWVMHPTSGLWWCTSIDVDDIGPIGTYLLRLQRTGTTMTWAVKGGTAVRYSTDNPQPTRTRQPTFTTARSMADEFGDRGRWLLDREPTDGEPLDVRS